MRKMHSAPFRAAAAASVLLAMLAQPASVLAAVQDLTLVKVPPDTRITLTGEEPSDRVEARTKEGDKEGQVDFKLQDRNWPAGKYILTIWEPAGSQLSELITLEDGSNRIDLSMILGDPLAPAADPQGGKGPQPNPGLLGGLAGAGAPGIVVGGGRRGGEEVRDRREDLEDRRGGGRGTSAGIAIGTGLVGALAGSLFGGSSKPTPPPPAQSKPAPPAAAQLAAEFVVDRVLATIPLADLAAMQALAQAIAADHNLTFLAVNALDSVNLGLAEYTILDGLDPLAKSAELAADARVESSQPEFIYQTTSKQEQLFYGRKLIRADVLPQTATGKGVRIALIDTGVDVARSELRSKILESVDMTGKGFTADVHGTMLAGIIAADRASGIGVAPSVELLAIKSCQAQRPQRIEGTCWSSTLTRGIDFANTKAARAINLSVGGPQDKLVTRLVNEAVKRNIVVVAAAGNDGQKGQPRYPAALDNVLAVTAVDADRQLYRDATRGKFVDVSAPGVEIVSLGPGTRLPISSGTSFAAAYVTGTIALLLEQRGSFTPMELQTALEKAARDLGTPGKDEEFGSGLVDICQTMEQLNPPNPCR
jgi:subtilisin family serine protease